MFFSYRKNLRIFIYVHIQGVDIYVIENHFRIPESKVNIKVDVHKLKFIYYLLFI